MWYNIRFCFLKGFYKLKNFETNMLLPTLKMVGVESRKLNISRWNVKWLRTLFQFLLTFCFFFFLSSLSSLFLFLLLLMGILHGFMFVWGSVSINWVIFIFNAYPESDCFIPVSSLLLYSKFGLRELFCLFSSLYPPLEHRYIQNLYTMQQLWGF